MTLSRRAFVGGAAGLVAASAAGALGLGELLDSPGATTSLTTRVANPPGAVPQDTILSRPASESPVDTVLVVMMENRSFDHYLGWLADDATYLNAGRRRYGSRFSVDGRVHQIYADGRGAELSTRPASSYGTERVETRGCDFREPGHSWSEARIQRDQGFVAPRSGNDQFALTYYTAGDLPVYAAMARRFTVFDQWHSSLLGPTFPNRQYLLSAQSEGRKRNPSLAGNVQRFGPGIYSAETILERLAQAGVSASYYYTRIPLVALWGTDRMGPFIQSLDRYFEDAAAGRLPSVAFIEPNFGGSDAYRTDDHPRGDIGLGQRWVREIFRAFTESPQWKSGAFILTYDEGGGFFDHVLPPLFADQRASSNDLDNFGQGGFRVPALLASPFAAPGWVDHRRYDHTSILRFLEWRFLGAPPEGAGGGNWSLTQRDRNALNMGAALCTSTPDEVLGYDVNASIPRPVRNCTPIQLAVNPPRPDADPFAHPDVDSYFTSTFPPAAREPWLADVPDNLD
ncbi:MAG: phosphoesterase [Acidimicrobiales bacterium]|nr:phosphoesterase [Acidimicrobiales bacterium]